jgi:hypothetical protein
MPRGDPAATLCWGFAMRHITRSASAGALAACLASTSGCAMFHRGPAFKPVSDADFGRLTPAQMGPVDAARSDLFSAHDAVARAKLRAQEAEQETERARADQTAARAELQRAGAELDAAQDSADLAAKTRAQELDATARLRSEEARAHAAFAQRQVDAREADVDAADAHVKVAEAQLERSKLTALRQAGLGAASKYDPATFDARVAAAEKDYQEARARANDAGRKSDSARLTWSGLAQQYQARTQPTGPASGTGAGVAPGAPPQLPAPAPDQPPAPPPPGAAAQGGNR